MRGKILNKLRFLFIWIFCPDKAIVMLAELEDERDALLKVNERLTKENDRLRQRIERIYRQTNEGTLN